MHGVNLKFIVSYFSTVINPEIYEATSMFKDDLSHHVHDAIYVNKSESY